MDVETVTIPKEEYERLKRIEKSMKTSRFRYLKEIKTLKEENEELKKCPKHGDKKLFRDIVEENTEYKMVHANTEQIEDAKMRAIAARDYQIDENGNIFKNKAGVERERPNEMGNDMEYVLKISSKSTLSGLGQATGYPDLENSSSKYYLECKVASPKSMETTMRSFYLSTLTKIKKTQPHILVCFKHRDGKLSKKDEPIVIDLYNLELKLKQEWNTSNKELYK